MWRSRNRTFSRMESGAPMRSTRSSLWEPNPALYPGLKSQPWVVDELKLLGIHFSDLFPVIRNGWFGFRRGLLCGLNGLAEAVGHKEGGGADVVLFCRGFAEGAHDFLAIGHGPGEVQEFSEVFLL